MMMLTILLFRDMPVGISNVVNNSGQFTTYSNLYLYNAYIHTHTSCTMLLLVVKFQNFSMKLVPRERQNRAGDIVILKLAATGSESRPECISFRGHIVM